MPEIYRHKLVSLHCYKFVINSRDHRSMEVVRSEWLDTHTATQKKREWESKSFLHQVIQLPTKKTEVKSLEIAEKEKLNSFKKKKYYYTRSKSLTDNFESSYEKSLNKLECAYKLEKKSTLQEKNTTLENQSTKKKDSRKK